VGERALLLTLMVYFSRTSARSFPGGKLLSGLREPLETHQIFPRAVLDEYPGRDNEYIPNRLGNLTLIARSDEEALGEIAPDIYLRMIEPSDRAAHLVPEDHALWNVSRYAEFCEQRERMLASMLASLLFELGAA
jgi:hypothetical protein